MDNLGWGLQITALGMGLVFGLLALLWGLLTLVQRWDRPAAGRAAGRGRARGGSGHGPCAGGRDRDRSAGASRAPPPRGGAGDAQPLAGQPVVCVALGGGRPHAAEPELATAGARMRRYTLGIGGREFVVDVQELDADRFEVAVGDERFEVTLRGDADLPEAHIVPALPSAAGAADTSRPSAPARAVAAAPRVARPGAAGASSSALAAPMPGVILELHVKAGDRVERGQAVAVLDAMKMHNLIGAPRAGVIAEVCVAAGQAVGHGDTIVRFGD